MFLHDIFKDMPEDKTLSELYLIDPKLETLVNGINKYAVYNPLMQTLHDNSGKQDLIKALSHLVPGDQLELLASYTNANKDRSVPTPTIEEREKTRFRLTVGRFAFFLFGFVVVIAMVMTGFSYIATTTPIGSDVFEHVINITMEVLKFLTTGL